MSEFLTHIEILMGSHGLLPILIKNSFSLIKPSHQVKEMIIVNLRNPFQLNLNFWLRENCNELNINQK